MRLLLLILLGTSLHGFTPKPPETLHLDNTRVLNITLNEAMDTLLIFPKQVDWISGVGLTDGLSEGIVHFEQDPDGKLLVLRPLGKEFKVILKLFMDGQVYVFKLVPSELPSSAITFTDEKGHASTPSGAAQITQAELAEALLPTSKKRQMKLIRLVREQAFLLPKLPHLYTDYTYKNLGVIQALDSFSIKTERVGRFKTEDTLVFAGQITNKNSKPMAFPAHRLRLRANDSATYLLSHFETDRYYLKPGEVVQFAAMLVGNGEGAPGAIRLTNQFKFHLLRN